MIKEKTLNLLLAIGVVAALVVLGFAIFAPPADTATLQQPQEFDELMDEPVSAGAASVITANSVNITMSAAPVETATVMPGSYITYTIVVTNTSLEDLPAYDITAQIPAGTVFDSLVTAQSATTPTSTSLNWQLANLTAGSSYTLAYRVRIANLPAGKYRLIINNFATLHIAAVTTGTVTSAEGTKSSNEVSHVIEAYEK